LEHTLTFLQAWYIEYIKTAGLLATINNISRATQNLHINKVKIFFVCLVLRQIW